MLILAFLQSRYPEVDVFRNLDYWPSMEIFLKFAIFATALSCIIGPIYYLIRGEKLLQSAIEYINSHLNTLKSVIETLHESQKKVEKEEAEKATQRHNEAKTASYSLVKK